MIDAINNKEKHPNFKLQIQHEMQRYFSVACLMEDQALKYCDSCKTFKLPRMSHCSKCHKCVLKYDHHCDLTNNCVGIRNHHMFIEYLLMLGVEQLVVILCLGYNICLS